MELGNDLRYGWRQSRRSTGFAVAAVLRRAIVLLTVGASMGIAASLGFSRIAGSMLSGVDVHNILLVIEAVTVILAITCITASYLPARRAAHTDPMQALRHE
jgi:ABC-type antimicrobial peptide transport system permease subunit